MSLEVEKSNESNESNDVYNNEINNWDELDIDSNLLRGIYSYGFENRVLFKEKQLNLLLIKKM